ncbi:PREDICTED: mitochondrial import receptor subunit TOM70-like [Wasmannia auropunctata]|uniref:mitochondrial import receptor subunit TOM70-like n=1 Tax=Wasmannia auropunctata TaxID=64793 RepID=UPI0005EDDC0C|nr:PREDICTED: mitochondrial import receptor subunit TOM70-like [Wasmannia auropunctata]
MTVIKKIMAVSPLMNLYVQIVMSMLRRKLQFQSLAAQLTTKFDIQTLEKLISLIEPNVALMQHNSRSENKLMFFNDMFLVKNPALGTALNKAKSIYCLQEKYIEAENATSATAASRRLLDGVFTPEALSVCSLSGMPPRSKGKLAYADKSLIKPCLCPNAVTAIIDKKYDDVVPLCTEIIQRPEFDKLPSSKLEVLLLRATFYILMGKLDSAIQDFERILNSENASDDVKTNALVKRGTLYSGCKDLEMAFKDFELAINMNPSYSEIYYFRGLLYWAIGRFDESTHDFDKAVSYNSNFCIAYLLKYSCQYYFIKNVCGFFNTDCTAVKLAAETAKHIKKCFKFYSSISERSLCYICYAQMLCESRQYEKADIFLVKAMKEDPENARIHVNRAILQLLWKNDVDKAAEHLTKALELDERFEGTHEILGHIAIRKGNLEEAIGLFDKALSLCRNNMELIRIFNLRKNAKLQLKMKNRVVKGPRSRYVTDVTTDIY